MAFAAALLAADWTVDAVADTAAETLFNDIIPGRGIAPVYNRMISISHKYCKGVLKAANERLLVY